MNGQSEGRNDAFLNSAYAQTPEAHFHSIQQNAGHEGFHPISVFDESQVLTPANGMSAQDRARQPVKGPTLSINGQSSNTFDKRMWIGSPYRTFGV